MKHAYPVVLKLCAIALMMSLSADRARAAVLFSTYTPGDAATYQDSPPIVIDYATPTGGFGAIYWHLASFEWTVTEPVSPSIVKLPAVVNQANNDNTNIHTNITVEVRTGNGPFKGTSVATGGVLWPDHVVGTSTDYTGSMISAGPIAPGTYYVLVEYYSIAYNPGASVDLYRSYVPGNGQAWTTDYYNSLSPGYTPAALDYFPAIQIEDGRPVPEPASIALLGIASIAMLRGRKRGS